MGVDRDEWGEPDIFEEWQFSESGLEVCSQAYCEASDELKGALREIPCSDLVARSAAEAGAYRRIDLAMDDAYEKYKSDHPGNIEENDAQHGSDCIDAQMIHRMAGDFHG